MEEKVREISEDLGFKDIILIDSHNSEGDIVDEEDVDELINKHYNSIFKHLLDQNYDYSIKFYNDDHFYNIYATESVNDSTFFVNVLNSIFSKKSFS